MWVVEWRPKDLKSANISLLSDNLKAYSYFRDLRRDSHFQHLKRYSHIKDLKRKKPFIYHILPNITRPRFAQLMESEIWQHWTCRLVLRRPLFPTSSIWMKYRFICRLITTFWGGSGISHVLDFQDLTPQDHFWAPCCQSQTRMAACLSVRYVSYIKFLLIPSRVNHLLQ